MGWKTALLFHKADEWENRLEVYGTKSLSKNERFARE